MLIRKGHLEGVVRAQLHPQQFFWREGQKYNFASTAKQPQQSKILYYILIILKFILRFLNKSSL